MATRTLTYRVILLFSLVAMLTAPAAYADSVNFSFSGSGIDASGTLYVAPQSGGVDLITGISGTQNGDSMTLLAPGAFAGNDNLIYPTDPILDFAGFSFVAGGIDYNVYFNSISCCGGTTEYYETTTPGVLGVQITGSVTPAPEPSSMLLLGSGVLGLLGPIRRKLLG